MMQTRQKSLEGEGREERKLVVDKMSEFWKKAFRSVELSSDDWNMLESFHDLLCQDILTQRRRIGGDWVMAGCVPHKRMRDMIRANLGPELVIVSLVMDEEDIMERLSSRHLNQESVVEGLMVEFMYIFMILYFIHLTLRTLLKCV